MATNEYFEEAKEELKRVDHIIYVSLKYTRTVDIIRNALQRMVSACDLIIEGMLWYHHDKKEIGEIPQSFKERISLVKKLYKDDPKFEIYITFYLSLRDLIKAPFTRREEYRRHVTMISQLKNQTAEITIDVLEDNFDDMLKQFLAHAELVTGVTIPE
jgi:hypothetical protein